MDVLIQDRIHAFNTLVSVHMVFLPSLYKTNFEYSAQKVLYHLDRFDAIIKELKQNISKGGTEITRKGWVIPELSTYFEFDAILISSRILFDTKITSDAKKELPAHFVKRHGQTMSSYRKQFESKIVPIRNDAVHLNENGFANPTAGTVGRTQVGPLVQYDLSIDRIDLLSSRMYDGKILDIIETVNLIKDLTTVFISEFHDLLVKSYFNQDDKVFMKYTIGVNDNSYELCLNDFEIKTAPNISYPPAGS